MEQELNFRTIKQFATKNQLLKIANHQLDMLNKILGTNYVPWELDPIIEDEVLVTKDIEEWFMKESATVDNTLACISHMINLSDLSSINPNNQDTHYCLLNGESVVPSTRTGKHPSIEKFVVYHIIHKESRKVYIGVMDVGVSEGDVYVGDDYVKGKLREDDQYLEEEGLIWDEIQKYGWDAFMVSVLPKAYDSKKEAERYKEILIYRCNERWDGRAYNNQFEVNPNWDPSIVEWSVKKHNELLKKQGNKALTRERMSRAKKKPFIIRDKETMEIFQFSSKDEFRMTMKCSPNTLSKFRRGQSPKYNSKYEILKG